jgi:putative restriction endonuclease
MVQGLERYALSMSKHRLGQGAFRVSVSDAYKCNCAITGEKTLPVLSDSFREKPARLYLQWRNENVLRG